MLSSHVSGGGELDDITQKENCGVFKAGQVRQKKSKRRKWGDMGEWGTVFNSVMRKAL